VEGFPTFFIDDPNRFYLHSVLENKVSSALTITILYAILANQVGIPFECLALPSTYLLKISDIDFDFYIEPFDSGKFLTEEEFQKKFKTSVQKNKMLSTKLFEKTNLSQLVSKLVQQLKHIYIIKGNAAVALRAVEVLTALYPNSPEHTRDRGILYCEMEYFSKAVEDLKYYLERRPQAEDFSEIKKLANMIKSYREVMN
jgi:regulator of sirC expression with transglutaminase-like and TPR domain